MDEIKVIRELLLTGFNWKKDLRWIAYTYRIRLIWKYFQDRNTKNYLLLLKTNQNFFWEKMKKRVHDFTDISITIMHRSMAFLTNELFPEYEHHKPCHFMSALFKTIWMHVDAGHKVCRYDYWIGCCHIFENVLKMTRHIHMTSRILISKSSSDSFDVISCRSSSTHMNTVEWKQGFNFWQKSSSDNDRG